MNLKQVKNLLLFSLAAEAFLSSYALLIGKQSAVVSVLYLVAGLVFIFSVIKLPAAQLPTWREIKAGLPIKWPLQVFIVALAFITSRYWIDEIPLDPDFADMLPVMKVMNERFLQGNWRNIYDPIPEIWNGVRPIYLPAMWLPYAPAIALKLDMRWVTVGAVLLSFSIVLLMIRIKKNGYFGYGFVLVAGVLFWWIFSRNDVHSLISMSEEGIVIFYFVLLCGAIISRNAFWMGLAASLCLLSRFSMVGWLIPCLFYFVYRKDWRRLAFFSVTSLLCILLFFLIPFGWKTMDQMIALPGNYLAFAKQVWENSPEVYWVNLGFAKFYGPDHIAELHQTLIVLSFCIPVIFMCFCQCQKKWKLENVNLACFKLSLLVFYQFIDVPFGYLFYTGVFVSLVIAASLLSLVNVEMNIRD